jgi:flagellar biogenesis protein FliO
MESVSLFASLLKMISALAIVLGVMLGAVYLFKKIMGQTASGADGG